MILTMEKTVEHHLRKSYLTKVLDIVIINLFVGAKNYISTVELHDSNIIIIIMSTVYNHRQT